MSAELTLLFLEKKVEAARLCASLTEPYATGSVPVEPDQLVKDYEQVVDKLHESYGDLKSLSEELDADKAIEPGDLRHVKQRISTLAAEVARAAQDFAAQIRFFEAMNPAEAAKVKPLLEKFDAVDKETREFTSQDITEEGAELAPAEETDTAAKGEPDIDPMLM